jgi:hypothetical protein
MLQHFLKNYGAFNLFQNLTCLITIGMSFCLNIGAYLAKYSSETKLCRETYHVQHNVTQSFAIFDMMQREVLKLQF